MWNCRENMDKYLAENWLISSLVSFLALVWFVYIALHDSSHLLHVNGIPIEMCGVQSAYPSVAAVCHEWELTCDLGFTGI